MAKRNSNPLARKQSGTKPADVALQASCQLDRLLDSLVKQTAPDRTSGQQAHVEAAILEAVAMRARALNSVILSALGDDSQPIEDLARVLHG